MLNVDLMLFVNLMAKKHIAFVKMVGRIIPMIYLWDVSVRIVCNFLKLFTILMTLK